MNKNEYRTLIIGLVVTLFALATLGIYSHSQNQKILGAQNTNVGVYIQKRPQDTIQNNQNQKDY